MYNGQGRAPTHARLSPARSSLSSDGPARLGSCSSSRADGVKYLNLDSRRYEHPRRPGGLRSEPRGPGGASILRPGDVFKNIKKIGIGMSCPSWQWHITGSRWSPVRTLPVAPVWCDSDLGFSRGNKAAANLRPRPGACGTQLEIRVQFEWKLSDS